MSNETKRDVFEEALAYAPVGREYDPVNDDEAGDLRSRLYARYAAALPDDLPVIPEAVGEYIIEAKAGHYGIGFVLMIGGHVMTSNRIAFEEWLTRANSYSDRIDRENTFARAWVLGAWRVEETGEIVKLEGD